MRLAPQARDSGEPSAVLQLAGNWDSATTPADGKPIITGDDAEVSDRTIAILARMCLAAADRKLRARLDRAHHPLPSAASAGRDQ